MSEVGKCLGFSWRRDLLATRNIGENVRKVRRAFKLGSIVFSLNPLSLASVRWCLTLKSQECFSGGRRCCIVPSIQHGCNSWDGAAVDIQRIISRWAWVWEWNSLGVNKWGVSDTYWVNQLVQGAVLGEVHCEEQWRRVGPQPSRGEKANVIAEVEEKVVEWAAEFQPTLCGCYWDSWANMGWGTKFCLHCIVKLCNHVCPSSI